MPIYDYECPKCLKKEEIFISQSYEEGFTLVCETCNQDLARIVSPSNFQLKGTGWYRPSAYQGDKE